MTQPLVGLTEGVGVKEGRSSTGQSQCSFPRKRRCGRKSLSVRGEHLNFWNLEGTRSPLHSAASLERSGDPGDWGRGKN